LPAVPGCEGSRRPGPSWRSGTRRSRHPAARPFCPPCPKVLHTTRLVVAKRQAETCRKRRRAAKDVTGTRDNGCMAPRGSQTLPPPDFEENIGDVDVSEEMRGSYLEYAYSVIYQRALPDARDGLKPVQRRILYSMNEMGLRPDRGHVKCARVVGEVMGKLHPHGDSSIYDAMVRQAQPWAMRVPLVDGHGNFGSLGGDDLPAAMRYTEARMSREALLMVTSIDEDTVDFRPNYDGQEMEPEVLPAAFPNLLVNGASGIAVGMATNMAPHNLGEVIAAA